MPRWLMDELMRAAAHRDPRAAGRRPCMCAGTLLSREQYLHDVEQHGYEDPRLSRGRAR